MPTVPLAGGHSAQMRDAETMTRREEMAHRKWMAGETGNLEDDDREGGVEVEDRVRNRIVHSLLESWTLTKPDGSPLVVSIAAVQDLSSLDFHRLLAVAKPAVDVLFGRGAPDPKSATSSDSPATPD
ncbi:hypothetical protein [Parafrankia soli]|nr:hypothetical protein [Parafrankia soli]